jgi:quinol monooxygenase YgiN
MAIHQTARFKVRPESRAKCEQAIREFVDYIKANEPDTLLYTAMQENEDATSFLHYFIFKDEAAQERHANSDGVKQFTAVLYPECLEPVEFKMFKIVASTSTI